MTLKVHMTTSLFAGYPVEEAVALCHAGVEEAFGPLSPAHIQLCPQNFGIVTEEVVDRLRRRYPDTRFRLHANVRVERSHRLVDASTPWTQAAGYFTRLADRHRRLGAPAYTLHVGQRSQASLVEMASNIQRLEELLGTSVGVEGLYPTPSGTWLLDSWEEYRWLLDSGLRYALDLSHLNILARRTRRIEMALVEELLASERCIEVHLSDNDGVRDSHRSLKTLDQWWWRLLDKCHPGAVLFSEGLQRALAPRKDHVPTTNVAADIR